MPENYSITYESDNCLKKGYFFIVKEIFYELNKNKWLTYQLFKRDFSAMYKQSLIGILWAFIIPLISVVTFIVLNRAGVFVIGRINIPYPVYAVSGIAFWQLFATGLVAGTNSLVKAGSMIVKINFSKKSLVLASYGQAIIPFIVQILLLCILFVVYRIVPDIRVLLIPLMIIPIILFTLGLSFIFSLLNAVLRDIGNIFSVFITFLMFLTPVLYVRPDTGILAKVTQWNILYYLVSVPRDIVITGSTNHLWGFFAATIVSVITFVVCLIVFHVTEVRIAERV